MFEPGNILYIHDYQFANRPRNKYLVVLCNLDNIAIVSSFTTSQQYVNEADIRDGIIKTANKHCYCFQKDIPVGTNDFKFSKTTFILPFQNVRTLPINKLLQNYRIEKICSLNKERFIDILYCIYTSEYSTNKIKREIDKLLNKLHSESE
jgi:hypothetical protein